jgi:hypothetical protein
MTPPNITPQELREIANWHRECADGICDYESRGAESRRISALACERWADEMERAQSISPINNSLDDPQNHHD